MGLIKYSTFIATLIFVAVASTYSYENVRKIEINGLKLNIPRSFLSMSSKIEPNGKETQLMLDFVFPEMKAGYGKGKESVSVWMEDVSAYINKSYKDSDDFLLYKYWQLLGMSPPLNVIPPIIGLGCIDKRCDIDFVNKGFDKDVNRILYIIKETVEKNIASDEDIEEKIAAETDVRKKESIRWWHEDHKRTPIYYKAKELYTNDDPKRPMDFIICSLGERTNDHSCKSAFFYKNIYFKLNFTKKDLINYDNVKKQFLSLIDTWSNINDR